LWFAAAAICTPASGQSSKEPLVLKPTSAWNVDYADDRCRLMREFGAGKDQVFAIFDRYGPDDEFRLTLAGKPFQRPQDGGRAIVQFGPAEAEQQREFYQGNLGELPALVFHSQMRVAPPTPSELAAIEKAKGDDWIVLAPVGSARESAIGNLTVGKPLRRKVTLEIGSMQRPFEALGKCVDDLITTWGINVERHRTLTQRVRPLVSPGRWIVANDYPFKMLSAGQPAIVEFRLSVDAEGRPSACKIQSTTRPAEFDEAVCSALMKRARFAPALDAEGKPLASYYRSTVRFQLPY
jgi:hypothetical protein